MLIIFIVVGRWAPLSIADSVGCHLVSFFISLSLSPACKNVVVRLGASGITAKIKGLILESQPERMTVTSQDRVNGLNDAVWRH
jgi:hypothetical protein